MIKKAFSTFKAAPLYGGFVLALLIVASSVKHFTGFPPFLSQLAIFGLGICIGIVAVIFGHIKEVKQATILKISNEIGPDLRFWQLEAQDGPNYRKYTYGGWILVKLSGYEWVLVDRNGVSEKLQNIRSQYQLDAALKTIIK